LVPMPKGSTEGMTWIFDIAGAGFLATPFLERVQTPSLQPPARAVVLTLNQALSQSSELPLTPATNLADDPAKNPSLPP
jgi:hypothetical protein